MSTEIKTPKQQIIALLQDAARLADNPDAVALNQITKQLMDALSVVESLKDNLKLAKEQKTAIDENEVRRAVMRKVIVRNPKILDEMSYGELRDIQED